MPSVALLNPLKNEKISSSTSKGSKLWNLFKQIIDTVITPSYRDDSNTSIKNTPKVLEKDTISKVSIPEHNIRNVTQGKSEELEERQYSKTDNTSTNRDSDNNDDDDNNSNNSNNSNDENLIYSLFPKKIIIDKNLDSETSINPCSLDMTKTTSSMTMTLTPQGNITCDLSTTNFNDLDFNREPSTFNINNKQTQVPPRPPQQQQQHVVQPISPESNDSPANNKKNKTAAAATLVHSPSSSSDKNINNSTENGHLSTSTSSSPLVEDTEEEGTFVCHYCDAKFRIRGYLTRHIKKHAIEKAYHCPFFNNDALPELRCHNSGGFSRRDTYKTHLKARHFIYPKGVKPQDRNKSSGHCSQCGEFFNSTDIWISKHLESGNCKALPKDYLKIIKPERKKTGKLKMIKTSTGHSRFISTAQSVVEPKVFLNKDALEAMAIVAHDTNRNDVLLNYGNNKLMMNTEDFQGEAKLKRKTNRTAKKIQQNKSLPNHTNIISSHSTNQNNNNNVNTHTHTKNGGYNPLFFNGTSQQDINLLETIPSSSSSLSSAESFRLNHYNLTSSQSPVLENHLLSSSDSHQTNTYDDDDTISVVPLDMEQSPYISITGTNTNNITQHPNVDKNVQKLQFNPVIINDRHIKETQQYLNFYNYSSGSNL
ncbi:C2H2-type zinc finger protein NDAI_0C00690 [Naumovozyma dairenensis CBS 421]|uniref:Transcription factor STP1 n=1 Tax=Naumovozyma dairenensis (strain ATCC 10597 / BCRC 20456 / CBS 421 / NBRC 0211 / NRRL Y-12639) TaxID=1071378 RepID=G0W7G9_NAUDC|nr:hypothetical protein NDAI_0C00690 [Naumovozyma dairenensis CBS 421]CCD23730.1 hypothetical protein NDAI_0C00690 [Naumovozyma dairenensis CBS 421]